MAIGKGNVTPTVEDQKLADHVDQANATVAKTAVTGQGDTLKTSLTLSANFLPLPAENADPQAITEAGVLLTPIHSPSPTSTSILYNLVVFPAVNRTSQISLSPSWEVTF